MKYSRRRFLGTAVAGAGAVLFSEGHAAAVPTVAASHDPYEKVVLGNTGISTTRLCMGTGISASNRTCALTRMGHEQAGVLLREVYARGVRMFDMADSYGTHGFVSDALKTHPRSDYVLFTKMWPIRNGRLPAGVKYPGAETEEEVMRFLKELQTDYIDGVQLHCISTGDWNTELSDYMTVLDKLKQKGVIRSHGISCHALATVKTAVNESWVDTIHVRFNAYGAKMDDAVEKVEPVVKQLHQQGKGVIAMKLIGEGAFANSDEQRDGTFSYVLRLGAVDVLDVGMAKISDTVDTESRIRKVPLQ